MLHFLLVLCWVHSTYTLATDLSVISSTASIRPNVADGSRYLSPRAAGKSLFPAEAVGGLTEDTILGPFLPLYNCVDIVCTPVQQVNFIASSISTVVDAFHSVKSKIEFLRVNIIGNLKSLPGVDEPTTVIEKVLAGFEKSIEILVPEAVGNATKTISKVTLPIRLLCFSFKVEMLIVHIAARYEDINSGSHVVDDLNTTLTDSLQTCKDVVGKVKKTSNETNILKQIVERLKVVKANFKNVLQRLHWFDKVEKIIDKVLNHKMCFDFDAYTREFTKFYNVGKTTADAIFKAAKALVHTDPEQAKRLLQNAGISIGNTISDAAKQVERKLAETAEEAKEGTRRLNEQTRRLNEKIRKGAEQTREKAKNFFKKKWFKRDLEEDPFILPESANSMLRRRRGFHFPFNGEMVARMVKFFQQDKICFSIKDALDYIDDIVSAVLNPVMGLFRKQFDSLIDQIQKHIPPLPSMNFLEPLKKLELDVPALKEFKQIVNILAKDSIFDDLLQEFNLNRKCLNAMNGFVDSTADGSYMDFMIYCV